MGIMVLDKIFNLIIEIFRWPILTIKSLFYYSMRELYKETPKDFFIMRILLKNAVGWTAIILIIRYIMGIDDESRWSINDIKPILHDRELLLVFIIITNTLPLLIGGWYLLGWRHLRARALRLAALRDATLLAWSAYMSSILIPLPYLMTSATNQGSIFLRRLTELSVPIIIVVSTYRVIIIVCKKYGGKSNRVSYLFIILFFTLIVNCLINLFASKIF